MVMSLLGFLLWLTLYLLIAVCIVVVILYFFFPYQLVIILRRLNLSWHGLRQCWVSLSGETLSYAERGTPHTGKTSIIFVHGFTSAKDAWTQTVKYLPRDVHVIAVDLPGHGMTSFQPDGDDLSVTGFTHYLHRLIRTLGLGDIPIHVVGQSMGGAVAAEYSAIYPQNVVCATLVCPAVKTPKTSEMTKIMNEENRMPLIVKTPEAMQSMLDLVMHRKFPVPKQILKGAMQIGKSRADFHAKLLKKLGKHVEQQSHLQQITTPVLVVWGEGDKVVDKSGIETLESHLTCPLQIEVLPNCGHVVNIERPRKLAKLLMEHQKSAQLHIST